MLRARLWPDETPDEHAAEARESLGDADLLALLCRTGRGEPIGFAEAAIRRDYVNGCETSPVVFLEGIYVVPEHRRSGVARALCARIAEWGRTKGCTEFASDALLDNRASQAFHAAAGFEETERVVYFRRLL